MVLRKDMFDRFGCPQAPHFALILLIHCRAAAERLGQVFLVRPQEVTAFLRVIIPILVDQLLLKHVPKGVFLAKLPESRHDLIVGTGIYFVRNYTSRKSDVVTYLCPRILVEKPEDAESDPFPLIQQPTALLFVHPRC